MTFAVGDVAYIIPMDDEDWWDRRVVNAAKDGEEIECIIHAVLTENSEYHIRIPSVNNIIQSCELGHLHETGSNYPPFVVRMPAKKRKKRA